MNERLREVYIEIIDDDEWEPDEIFFVKLCMPHESKEAVVGKMAINQITIINDDGKNKTTERDNLADLELIKHCYHKKALK